LWGIKLDRHKPFENNPPIFFPNDGTTGELAAYLMAILVESRAFFLGGMP
jgi:hypothetical protein